MVKIGRMTKVITLSLKNIGSNFPSLAILGIPVRLVLFKSLVLSDSEGILFMMLLFGSQSLWLEDLDYCNSLFRILSALGLCRLQCVQNTIARIVVNTTKF